MTKNSNSAFTLLEILLVVGIIAILAGIVIIAINPGKQLASVRNTQRLSDLKQLNNAITQFYIDKGTYPASTTLSTTTLTEICNTGSVSATTTSINGALCSTLGLTDLSELVPVYIVAIPTDPMGSSSLLGFIPTANAASDGTGYKIMRTLSNQIIEQAPLAELNVPVAIGNTSLSWKPISGLVAHYLMNDNAGNTNVADSKSNPGTAQRFTSAMATSGLISSALYFNGTSDYVSLPSGVAITGSNPRTITAWVKPQNVNIEEYITGWGSGSTGGCFNFGIGYGNYTLLGYGGAGRDFSSTIIPTYNSWQFVAVSFNGTTATITKMDGSGTTSQTSGTLTLNTTNNNPIIGNLSYANTKFAGAIDDVRIYNRALSASELTQIYNGGAGTANE